MKNLFNYYFIVGLRSIIYKLRRLKIKEIEYKKDTKTYWEYKEKR